MKYFCDFFQAPVKNDPWTGVLDAFDFKLECLQNDFRHKRTLGAEDCLYLNVFIPMSCAEMNSSAKMPVFIYIQGGKFMYGTSRNTGPDFLLNNNVIVVCVKTSSTAATELVWILFVIVSGNF